MQIADRSRLLALRLSAREWTLSLLIALGFFLALGTLTALWRNPLFVRMTPITGWDFVILGLEALGLGLYLGVRAPACAVSRAGLGGVLGFLGFGCSTCNQVLMLIFGASFLLTWFEPYRYGIGFAGIAVLGLALTRKLRLRAESLYMSPA
jgi:hypothetical protein